jgi:hypothetical protein
MMIAWRDWEKLSNSEDSKFLGQDSKGAPAEHVIRVMVWIILVDRYIVYTIYIYMKPRVAASLYISKSHIYLIIEAHTYKSDIDCVTWHEKGFRRWMCYFCTDFKGCNSKYVRAQEKRGFCGFWISQLSVSHVSLQSIATSETFTMEIQHNMAVRIIHIFLCAQSN